jgi:hypothetical protein
MTIKLLVVLILALCSNGQSIRSNDGSPGAVQETLAAVLDWEILWNDSPAGFRRPNDGQMTLAISATPDFVSYCSHQAGVCTEYRRSKHRNWEGTRSTGCNGIGSDEDALLAFAETARPPISSHGQRMPLGGGGLVGLPALGIRWIAKLHLDTRAEIVGKYKRLHPANLETLEEWIRAQSTAKTGVGSITIACFSDSDPMIYYSVDRKEEEPSVIAVLWDSERLGWIVASSLEQSQNSERFAEMHRIIESVACSTISLE